MSRVKITIIYNDEQIDGEGTQWALEASMTESGTNAFLNIERWNDDVVQMHKGGPLYGWVKPSSRREIDFVLKASANTPNHGFKRKLMAAFCHQCAIDCAWDNDFVGITTEADWENGLAAWVLCEGCSPLGETIDDDRMIQVDPQGRCVTDDCLRAGKPGHGLPWKNENGAETTAPITLAASYSRLAMMARGEAWPADEKDRAIVARSIRLILDRLNKVEQCAAVLDEYADPGGHLR